MRMQHLPDLRLTRLTSNPSQIPQFPFNITIRIIVCSSFEPASVRLDYELGALFVCLYGTYLYVFFSIHRG